jgi:hypothetical protein
MDEGFSKCYRTKRVKIIMCKYWVSTSEKIHSFSVCGRCLRKFVLYSYSQTINYALWAKYHVTKFKACSALSTAVLNSVIWFVNISQLKFTLLKIIFSLLAYFSYFEKKIKVDVCGRHAVWVSPHKLLNGGTNLYETWYLCHGTWVHLNGVCLKSIPLVSVSVCVSPYCC